MSKMVGIILCEMLKMAGIVLDVQGDENYVRCPTWLALC